MASLFEDYPGRRPVDLARMDGLPFTPSCNLPHAIEMARWRGLYGYDLEGSRFFLTKAGRSVLAGAVE